MEINFPNLINSAIPERDRHNRNAIILSSNSSANHNESGFLSSSFPRNPRKLFITAEGDTFDNSTLNAWRAEGFEVRYFGLPDDYADGNGKKKGGGDATAAYRARLSNLRNEADLGPCETFGIIAFGDAASLCLEFFHRAENNPDFKLAVLIAYYPTTIPDPRGQFPGGLKVVAHLAGDEDEVGVVMHSQIVGIQGKKKVVRRVVGRGEGVGRSAVKVGGNTCAFPCYRYEAPAGFAEADLDEFEGVAAELAWGRSLGAVRGAFRMDVELEGVVEGNWEGKFLTKNLDQTMATYTTHKPPHATYFPTLSGGIGAAELRRFYGTYFLTSNPDSTRVTLISRTVGADRVVDELHVAFRHTTPMPWILPGVPATNKRVEVAVVSIVALRGGRLCHEHVYWDQASVLMQVGLLDPKLLPEKARKKGVTRLPVVGREAARRLLHGFEGDEDEGEEGEADNELLPGWYDDDDDDYESEEVEGGKEGNRGNGVRDGEKGKQGGKGGDKKERKMNGNNPRKHDEKKADEAREPEREEREKPQKVAETANGGGRRPEVTEKPEEEEEEVEEKEEPKKTTETVNEDDNKDEVNGEQSEDQNGGVTSAQETSEPDAPWEPEDQEKEEQLDTSNEDEEKDEEEERRDIPDTVNGYAEKEEKEEKDQDQDMPDTVNGGGVEKDEKKNGEPAAVRKQEEGSEEES